MKKKVVLALVSVLWVLVIAGGLLGLAHYQYDESGREITGAVDARN